MGKKLFDAGKDGKSIYEFLKQRGEGNFVTCFCDNDKELWRKKIGDVSVFSYEPAVRNEFHRFCTQTLFLFL